MGYVDALIADAQRDVRRLKEDMDSGFANTRLGRACKAAREEFRHAKQEISHLKEDIAAARSPHPMYTKRCQTFKCIQAPT